MKKTGIYLIIILLIINIVNLKSFGQTVSEFGQTIKDLKKTKNLKEEEFKTIGKNLKEITKASIEWVNIPAGTYTMGSHENEVGRKNNETQHQVRLSAFKMSAFEVTFNQYDAFCIATGRKKPDDNNWGRGNRPVINVSWNDAIAFAEWMDCRLPTEAEWEYACRAGTTTPFNTGNNLTTSQANYDGNYPYNNNAKGENRYETVHVGSFIPANAFGLYDMHGNVDEWCSDWEGDYPSTEQTDPKGSSSGTWRVFRGGSSKSGADNCRSANRGFNSMYRCFNFIGFRLVFSNIKDSYTKTQTRKGTFTDLRDGQTYATIKISSQTWFAENLNYKTNSWCYNNSSENGDIYGRLYTWNAANKACPSGWHLPSYEEWNVLGKALGMSQNELDSEGGYIGTDEGEKLKSTSGWSKNGNGTGNIGFNALPGGGSRMDGAIDCTLGEKGKWWSSSEYSDASAWHWGLDYRGTQVWRSYKYKSFGMSVRCIKD